MKDLIAVRLAAGQDLRFGVTAERVEGAETDRPRVIAIDAEGEPLEIEAEFVVGADGSRSVARAAVTGSQTGGYSREYPFARSGILCEAPPSAPELIHSNSPNGFALISQRSATVQRMYLQCDPQLDPELDERAPDLGRASGQRRRPRPHRGSDLPARRAAVPQLRRPRAAARPRRPDRRRRSHGAAYRREGTNLAVADVVLLDKALRAFLLEGDSRLLEAFPETALHRIWKAQHFSWWMTNMLHVAPDATDFDGSASSASCARWSSRRRADLPRRGLHGVAARGSLTRPSHPVHPSHVYVSDAHARTPVTDEPLRGRSAQFVGEDLARDPVRRVRGGTPE